MITAQSTIPGLNRFLSNALSQTLTAFVVPGMEIAGAYQLDFKNSGLILTDVPRHANVLVLVGDMPKSLRHHALTLYNQMPAPKAILAIGTTVFDPLPVPDATADFSSQSIKQSVGTLRELFAKKAFEKNGIHAEKVNEPTQQGHDMQNMEGMDHGSDMGFMSMVMMTENLPKSPDGLPMEWSEVRFGPLFAGLPAGLELTFLLDGDSVAETQVSTDSVKRNLEKKWPGSVDNFLNTFSLIDPITPHTYRILAELALENAIKKSADENTKSERVFLLEKERVIGNLNWLASFAALLHFPSMRVDAENQLIQVRTAHTAEDYNLQKKNLQKMKSTIENNWLLKKRLSSIGINKSDGSDAWTRLVERVSEVLESISIIGSYLQNSSQRHPELVSGSNTEMLKLVQHDKKSYSGKVFLKTPRGKAELSIALANGKVSKAQFFSPSAKKITLIPQLVQNSEVGDALIAISSLDISPWEAAL